MDVLVMVVAVLVALLCTAVAIVFLVAYGLIEAATRARRRYYRRRP